MESMEKPVGFVYGLRLKDEAEHRYVGLTEGSVAIRLRRHLACARRGERKPVYDWMRKHGAHEVVADVLEMVMTNREDLGAAEIAWIARRRGAGDRLLNVSDGGIGPTGVIWTVEQREAARRRSTGRRGVSRPGPANPFFGKHHSDEQRARWTAARKGTNSGAANPNFGKFGPDHPSYGHTMSEESRAKLSAMRLGPLNPNFGKTASEETRAKRRASQLGIPKPSSARNAHIRYHTKTGTFSAACRFCAADALAADATGETTP